jgi:hypothetical protein
MFLLIKDNDIFINSKNIFLLAYCNSQQIRCTHVKCNKYENYTFSYFHLSCIK